MAVTTAVMHTWNNVGTYSSGVVDVSLYQELIIDCHITALTIAANQYVQIVLSRLDAFGHVIFVTYLVTIYGNSPPALPSDTGFTIESGFGGKIQIDLFTTDPASRISGTLSVLAKGVSLL